MSNFLDLVGQIKGEVDKMSEQYQAIQTLKRDIEIEQEKIKGQNETIKHTLEAVEAAKKRVEDKEKELGGREKQIVVREKQNLLIDQKMRELEDRTTDVILRENKLKEDQEAFNKEKAIMDKKTVLYQKLEETEKTNKARLKLKEDEVDKELQRLKSMNL